MRRRIKAQAVAEKTLNVLAQTGEGGAISTGKRSKLQKIAVGLCFAAYLATVLWYTIGRRNAGYYPAHFNLFWSYQQWFQGDRESGQAILANIAMFVPFGFFVAAMGRASSRTAFLRAVFLALVFSAFIESAQFFLMRGYFEFDDIFNNVFGAVLGALFFLLLKRSIPQESLRGMLYMVNAGILIFCLGVLFLIRDHDEKNVTTLSRGLCFQVEDASYQDGRMEVSGVCFWYDRGPIAYTILLRSTKTGESYPLQTESCLPRPDVSAYFHLDSLKAGFQASGQGIAENEEYEVAVDFGFHRVISTGVLLTAEKEQAGVHIHSVPDAVFVPLETEGTDLEEITAKGVLLSSQPVFHVYVYFYEGSLYWIAEDGFFLEDDGRTFMNAVLWTTEPEKISQYSKDLGLQYDALGVSFEIGEVSGNFGRYRVCAWKLPKDYPITSIMLGYFYNGWVWKEYCWPVYDFSQYIAQPAAS